MRGSSDSNHLMVVLDFTYHTQTIGYSDTISAFTKYFYLFIKKKLVLEFILLVCEITQQQDDDL